MTPATRPFGNAQAAGRDVGAEERDVGLRRTRRAPGDARAVGLEATAVDRPLHDDAGGAGAGEIRVEIIRQHGIVDEAGTGAI